jgi:dTDP-4-dehydrorhamnose reductase
MTMPILVTGASGQFGGYLLQVLTRQGTPVVAWGGSGRGTVAGVPLRPVDLSDADAVAVAFWVARPAVVIHAGAVTSIAACTAVPVLGLAYQGERRSRWWQGLWLRLANAADPDNVPARHGLAGLEPP